MPRADFRLKGDVLDPRAPVKVLCVMCHPGDARGREYMMRRASEVLVFPRNQGRRFYPDDLRQRGLWAEFLDHRLQGCAAGVVALALAQLRAMHRKAEPALVLKLAAGIAGQIEIENQPGNCGLGSQVGKELKEAEIAAAFHAYRSVAHLWAALVYGSLKRRLDLCPVSVQTLPIFLAYAEEIAWLAADVAWQETQPGFKFDPAVLWTFILPAALKKRAKAQIMPALPSQDVQREARHSPQPAQMRYNPSLKLNGDV